MFNKGIELLKKQLRWKRLLTNCDAGKGLYEQKLYKEAAAIFEISTSNKESKIICLTNFPGNSLYFDNTKTRR
jgi:hypothetical protein